MRDEILIGEGVWLDVRPASFASRLLGALLDLLVIGFLLYFSMFLASAATLGRTDDAVAVTVGLIVTVALLVGFPTTFETLTRGKSLGKLAAGLRVVRDDGGPVRFRHALIRALVGVLEIWLTLGSVALITSLVHPKGKRLGDILAGTYAIRTRGGQEPMGPLVMPAHLAGWAHQADIRRLPDGLALRARQFLSRAGGLHPGSRFRLGTELAAEVEQYVAPGPPLGTHPELFLAAVLAERRSREYTRSLRQAREAVTEARLLHRLPYAVPDPEH